MFALQAQMAVAGAGGDDDGLRFHLFAVHRQDERAFGQIGRLHALQRLDARAEAFRLLLHAHHQFVAVDALRESRENSPRCWWW